MEAAVIGTIAASASNLGLWNCLSTLPVQIAFMEHAEVLPSLNEQMLQLYRKGEIAKSILELR
jgi:hypothetical protein